MPSRQAKYMARKRAEWRAAGRCIFDGRESGGKIRCPECAARHIKEESDRRHAKRNAAETAP